MPKKEVVEVEVVEVDINELSLVTTYDSEKNQMVTNAQQMKSELANALTRYVYEVNEANKADAEKDRAELNKLVKKISDQRKSAEAQIMGSWKDDKKSIMDMEKMITVTANELGEGINALNMKAEQEKYEKIKAWWDAKQTGVPYELVHEKQFLNNSCTNKKCAEMLEKKIEKINQDKEILPVLMRDLSDSDKVIVWDAYNQTLDLQIARNKIDDIIRIRETEKLQAEQKAKEQAYVQQVQEEEQRTPSVSETVNMTNDDPVWTLTCRIPQFALLFDAMKENGITSKSFDEKAVKGTFVFHGFKEGFINFKNQLEQNGFEITDIQWSKGE